MKNLILLSILLLSFQTTYSQTPAVVASDKTGWHKIGDKTVDFATETDEIVVLGADRFASIKIKVEKAPIHLVSFVIYFEGGEKQTVKISREIKAPGETQTIQLNGGERSIKKVVFTYKTVANVKDQKASVELWGLKTNANEK